MPIEAGISPVAIQETERVTDAFDKKHLLGGLQHYWPAAHHSEYLAYEHKIRNAWRSPSPVLVGHVVSRFVRDYRQDSDTD